MILILILEDMKKMTEYVKRSDVIKIMEDNLVTIEVPETGKREIISAYGMYQDLQKIETVEIDTEIGASEKQTPKEPKYKKQLRDFFGMVYITKGDCPCCGKAEIYSNANYCPDCGQKLDWGKEEDNGR